MLDLILSLIPGQWVAYAGVAIGAVLALWFGGRGSVKADVKAKVAAETDKQHARINNADTGIGATDDERVKRLREFAKKHGS